MAFQMQNSAANGTGGRGGRTQKRIIGRIRRSSFITRN